VGGMFYLMVAFMIISALNDIAKRSVDQRMITRIGLIPNLDSLLYSLFLLYAVFTFFTFVTLSLAGMSLFDSLCQSLGTVSGGGFGAYGRTIRGGIGIHLLLAFIMAVSSTGYYVHMSVFSARGRMRSLFDNENLFYWTLILTMPVAAVLIFQFNDYGLESSVWKGIFSTVSAITTTGFMVEGMNMWPEALKFLLLLLLLLGGSSLSVASGFKLHRMLLLSKGFSGEVKKSSHPRVVISLRRGEGTYSIKALEAANVTFFYLFSILGFSVMILLMFHGNILDVISLCVTSISNGGIAYGDFSSPEGISAINWAVKSLLMLVMFLGRFDILLPLFFITPRSYTFSA
jgi:trk system potassium uptake protein TrkH